MRVMLRLQIDAIRGSEGIKSGATQKAIAAFVEKHKPEAVYFTNTDGERSGFFVFDMKDAHEMPIVCEPLFDIGARVQISPCMTPDDLQKAFAAIGV